MSLSLAYQGDASLQPPPLPSTSRLQVEPTGSKDPEVGKAGVKQGHVVKSVNPEEIA
jgi:hypothetical protein